eukprot:3290366-Rhodomonas_salina.3
MNTALCVHQDHVSAVLDVDFSPTGKEFVTGSYDRTVRIFPFNAGHSREVATVSVDVRYCELCDPVLRCAIRY